MFASPPESASLAASALLLLPPFLHRRFCPPLFYRSCLSSCIAASSCLCFTAPASLLHHRFCLPLLYRACLPSCITASVCLCFTALTVWFPSISTPPCPPVLPFLPALLASLPLHVSALPLLPAPVLPLLPVSALSLLPPLPGIAVPVYPPALSPLPLLLYPHLSRPPTASAVPSMECLQHSSLPFTGACLFSETRHDKISM